MSYEAPSYADDHPAQQLAYRPCVGAVIFNRDGLVFSGHRVQKDLPPDAPRWQWPQGGIDDGETPIAAAHREIYEETGIRAISLIYELPGWLTYDLPESLIGKVLKGNYRGQKQKWFAFRFEGADEDVKLDAHPEIEFESWQWRNLSDCIDLVVPFKRHVYQAAAAGFAHLSGSEWRSH